MTEERIAELRFKNSDCGHTISGYLNECLDEIKRLNVDIQVAIKNRNLFENITQGYAKENELLRSKLSELNGRWVLLENDAVAVVDEIWWYDRWTIADNRMLDEREKSNYYSPIRRKLDFTDLLQDCQRTEEDKEPFSRCQENGGEQQECEHEWDFPLLLASSPPQNEYHCKKCGCIKRVVLVSSKKDKIVLPEKPTFSDIEKTLSWNTYWKTCEIIDCLKQLAERIK